MEGPSLVLLKEELRPFAGQVVLRATGNTHKLPLATFRGVRMGQVRTWGKQLLLRLGKATLRIHFLMYGSYRINEKKKGRIPRLSLRFPHGEVNFYSCSVRPLEESVREVYDWTTDPMSRRWSEAKAVSAIRARPREPLCDLLLDQSIFSGVGNIIKNEVLFRVKRHPLTLAGALSKREVVNLVRETRKYCFQFYRWKKVFELKKHWLIYRKKTCPDCGSRVAFERTGKHERVSFYCPSCQPVEKH